MNLKKSSFEIQEKVANENDKTKENPTITDLLNEQKVLDNCLNTVHHRRDLDSLG